MILGFFLHIKEMILIIIFVLYQFLQILSLPVFVGYLFLRKFKKKSVAGNLKERFGFLKRSPKDKKIYWVHAVSVGEILSVQDFINNIKYDIEDSFVYVTVGTIQGKRIAQKNRIGDCVSFLPFDFLLFVWLAFRRVNPDSIILVEGDLWPNFMLTAKFKKIPTYLLNARVSKKSLEHAYIYKKIMSPLINTFKFIFTQNKSESEKFKNLGISEKKLITLGNIKALNVFEKQKMFSECVATNIDGPVLMVGSLHPAELGIYLELFLKLKKDHKKLKLILAPRHFQWKSELINKVNAARLKFVLWEKEESLVDMVDALKTTEVLLVCKLGELFALYPICNVFFLGGTFVPVGGHNLLEPAVWGKVSIVGPHYFNSKQIADSLEVEGGLMKVKEGLELFEVVNHLLTGKSYIERGSKAREWILKEVENVRSVQDRFLNELKKI